MYILDYKIYIETKRQTKDIDYKNLIFLFKNLIRIYIHTQIRKIDKLFFFKV